MKLVLHRKSHIFSALASVFFAAFSAVSCFAVPLADYRQKIESAKENLDILLGHDEEIESVADMRAEEHEYFGKIRSDLKEKMTVEFGKESFEVDNFWILNNISQMEAAEPNSDKQRAIIGETLDRLSAVEVKLNELEQQLTGNRTKDEDKQKLGEILKRPEYAKPVEEKKSALEETIDKFFKWLESLFPKSSQSSETATGSPTLSFALQILLYGAIFAVIGFLIYRFAPFLREKFGNRERREKRERIVLGEKLAADETSENLFAEAEKLAHEGNLRAAIRKGYIAFLCELGDRKIIGLSKHKTNRDYLRDVRKRPALHQNMNSLTKSFERVWYGFSQAEPQDWEAFREKYEQAVNEK